MNAAFLLVTSAWFAGQTPGPAPAVKAAPVPATAAPIAGAPIAGGGPIVSQGHGSCNNCGSNYYAPSSCDICCDSGHGGGGFFSKMRGRFGRHGQSDCCNTCDTGCGHGHSRNWTWSSSSCCDTCDTGCGHGSGGGFFSKLKGRFGRHHGQSDCCGYGDCGSCGCGNTPYVGGAHGAPVVGGAAGTPIPSQAPAGGETITAPPKKMPSNNPPANNPAPAKQVRINTAPAAPIAPVAPSIEVAPPAVPSIDADRREPF